jgi:hypothetical protein
MATSNRDSLGYLLFVGLLIVLLSFFVGIAFRLGWNLVG